MTPESKVAAPVGGVDVLAVLRRHADLAKEVGSPEQVSEACDVLAAVAELVRCARRHEGHDPQLRAALSRATGAAS